VERYDNPRERLLAVFEGQGELFAQPDYRGCAFARASAESHPGRKPEEPRTTPWERLTGTNSPRHTASRT